MVKEVVENTAQEGFYVGDRVKESVVSFFSQVFKETFYRNYISQGNIINLRRKTGKLMERTCIDERGRIRVVPPNLCYLQSRFASVNDIAWQDIQL